ncbi:hypothetical protein EK904_004647 [Melospiza melodia maxima]|nr:hypothetical protein EK904_004647 [Melospiza melodia maxima]
MKSETTTQVVKQRKPWMCKRHRNKIYKDKYKRKKSDQALGGGGAAAAGGGPRAEVRRGRRGPARTPSGAAGPSELGLPGGCRDLSDGQRTGKKFRAVLQLALLQPNTVCFQFWRNLWKLTAIPGSKKKYRWKMLRLQRGFFSRGRKDSAEGSVSVTKQRTGSIGDRPARPTLLEQVLNKKRLKQEPKYCSLYSDLRWLTECHKPLSLPKHSDEE